MNYKSYDDEALRRILIADPDDTLAICEAAERFVKQDGYTEADLDDARDEGYRDGYDDGRAEGERQDDSR